MLAPAYRNILLWRHADALPLNAEIMIDIDRPLSKKGNKQARKMANWLSDHLPKNTIIITSTAVRANQTAKALNHEFIVLDKLDPGASLADVLHTINALTKSIQAKSIQESNNQDNLNLLIVGHQPWLGEFAAYLLNLNQSLPTEEVNIKKGTVWWFKRDGLMPQQIYNLLCLQTPSLL
jgi:phosphohistidine phosphatase